MNGSGARSAPTIGDVARLAGVSAGAVSYAMNDRPGVSEQTRQRIRQAADSLGWQPSGVSRAMLRRRTQLVGLVVPAPRLMAGSEPLGPFLAGLGPALAAAGYTMLLRTAGTDPRAPLRAYRRMWQQRQVDGMIVGAVRDPDPRLELLAGTNLPVVVADRLSGHPDARRFLRIDADHRAGIRRAVRHLVSLGHRRIGLVAGPADLRHTSDQLAAWRSTLAGAGLQPGPVAHDDRTAAGGARATARLCPQPSAIVYGADAMAIGGLGALRDNGIAVPREVSVVGFGDMPLAGYVSPALTTIRVDYPALGRDCAELLMAALNGGPTPAVRPARAQLVVRDSTGPCGA